MSADALRELAALAQAVSASAIPAKLEQVADLAVRVLRDCGTLFFCGNGGSAADAQHMAAEYVVRYRRDRPGIPAIALTADSVVLTAGGNDYGWTDVFARQVTALCRPGDLLFLTSTSGESENLMRAAAAARTAGVVTVAFLARGGGRLAGMVDHALVVPTDSTARAQEIHLAMGHAVCEMVEGRRWSR